MEEKKKQQQLRQEPGTATLEVPEQIVVRSSARGKQMCGALLLWTLARPRKELGVILGGGLVRTLNSQPSAKCVGKCTSQPRRTAKMRRAPLGKLARALPVRLSYVAASSGSNGPQNKWRDELITAQTPWMRRVRKWIQAPIEPQPQAPVSAAVSFVNSRRICSRNDSWSQFILNSTPRISARFSSRHDRF